MVVVFPVGVVIVVAKTLVILRLWVRTTIVRKVGVNDWFIAASLVRNAHFSVSPGFSGKLFTIFSYVFTELQAHDLQCILDSESSVICLPSFLCPPWTGKTLHKLDREQFSRTMKIFWVAMFITPSAEAFAKVLITIMLMRITTSKK